MRHLTVFYDGQCPLCLAEINQLRALDKHQRLGLVDIHRPDFQQAYPHIDPVQANRVLHGQFEDGEIIYGLDVTSQAWKRVGKHRWLSMLRWPVIRWFADLAYRFFARFRHQIAYLLTGRSRCEISTPDCQPPDSEKRSCDCR